MQLFARNTGNSITKEKGMSLIAAGIPKVIFKICLKEKPATTLVNSILELVTYSAYSGVKRRIDETHDN
jgi:hypothetical protein